MAACRKGVSNPHSQTGRAEGAARVCGERRSKPTESCETCNAKRKNYIIKAGPAEKYTSKKRAPNEAQDVKMRTKSLRAEKQRKCKNENEVKLNEIYKF